MLWSRPRKHALGSHSRRGELQLGGLRGKLVTDTASQLDHKWWPELHSQKGEGWGRPATAPSPWCTATPHPPHDFLLQIHTQGRGIPEGSHLSLKENGSTLVDQILEATSAWFLIKENLKKVFSDPDRMGTPKEIKSPLKNGENHSSELEIHTCCEYLKMLAWDYIIIELRLGLEAAEMSKNKRAQWQSKPENWGEPQLQLLHDAGVKGKEAVIVITTRFFSVKGKQDYLWTMGFELNWEQRN